jgi:glutamate 5-kinase
VAQPEQSQTLVVKIGTSSLTQPESGRLALGAIAALVETLAQLRRQGRRVVLVSSGAVGVGCSRLGIQERPKKMALKQAVAAVGQGRLMRLYDDFFTALEQPIAQVLLTRRELMNRNSYVNIANTFQALFELGVIPIVNENDTVAIDELKFGDNDTLSALVAGLLEAQWLFILTDVDGLYSADPRLDPQARPIPVVNPEELGELQIGASAGSAWGTGGMATKLAAARIASASGVTTVITQGKIPGNISQILNGAALGTQFLPQPHFGNARKRWIAFGLIPTGKLWIDDGAARALRQGGRSLLAVGIQRVEGDFSADEAVQICDAQGREIARGLVNYNSQDLGLLLGRRSEEFAALLGYEGDSAVVHRDNLTLAPPAGA